MLVLIALGKYKNIPISKESKERSVKWKSHDRDAKNKTEAQRGLGNYQSTSSSPPHPIKHFSKLVAFKQLTINDLSEALRVAASEGDVKRRGELFGIIACEWAKTDPDGCFKWAETLELPSDKQSALINLLQATASKGGVQKALELFDQIPKGHTKDVSLVFTFMYIAAFDVEGAIKRVGDVSGSGAVNAIATLLSAKMVSDGTPSKIAELWETLKPGEFRDLFGAALIDSLNKDSPSAAKDWKKFISDDVLTVDELGSVERQIAARTANAGITLPSDTASIDRQDSDQSRFGHQFGLKEPVAAKNWLLEITSSADYENYSDMASAVVEELVRWDQDAALKNISTIKQNDIRNNLMFIAAKELSLINPARGVELLFTSKNPDAAKIGHVVARGISVWMNKDPLAASEWIGLQNSGPLKDVAIKSLVENSLLREENHDVVLPWIHSIQDAQLRKGFIEQIQGADSGK